MRTEVQLAKNVVYVIWMSMLRGIAVISFLAAVVVLIFFPWSIGKFILFAILCGIFFFCFQMLKRGLKKNRSLIAEVNQKESAQFDVYHMLGADMGPGFMAFDTQNRQIVIANGVSGDYQIHPFSHVLKWYVAHGTGVRTHVNITGGGPMYNNSAIRQPLLEQETYKRGFKVMVEVADVNHPVLPFMVANEQVANAWVARLNAIFNHP